MARPRSFDEDAVLDRAVQLFQERGFERTSLADLEAHLGLGRQSLYNTFGDKETLFLKALDRYRHAAANDVLALLNAPGAGLDSIRAFFRATVETLTAPPSGRTCLIATTLLERASDDPEALMRCSRACRELERSLRRALTQAKADGELPEALDVEAAGTLLVVHNYGLNVLAKSGATAEELWTTVELLLDRLR